jgi:hypothetical protein
MMPLAVVFHFKIFIEMLASDISNENHKRRDRKVTLRFTQPEYDAIKARAGNTTCNKLSQFLRAVLLNQQLTVFTRNRSADDYLELMLAIKSELNAIGNNYNQVVKKLHQLSRVAEIGDWMQIHAREKERFEEKCEALFTLSQKIYGQWLQE